MVPTLELVNKSGHGSLSNGGASGIKVNGLTASWTHVRKLYYFIKFLLLINLQDKEKFVLEDINFTVDQVKYSTPYTVSV